MHEAGEKVGRCRRDQHHVVVAGELDVGHAVVGTRVPEVAIDRPTRQCLKRRRADEFTCGGGHRRRHFMARLDQQPHQLGRFVGSNAAGDAEQHALRRFDLSFHARSVAVGAGVL